ncbi:MAG: DUF444 family protein [Betaproteobacteria bacterium]|nr:DUF444 family protein [Betaproteobacteria bacterium]
MAETGSSPPRPSRIAAETPWYDLFSRGARDWLRHNRKVRDAVMKGLPELLSGGDMISRPENRTVLVPVRLLEHARFRLSEPQQHVGAGQGQGEPGDVLRPAREQGEAGAAGGRGEGELQFVLELKVDDILDWLWEELKLPELKPKRSATLEEPDFVREGWDKRGARSRLDRRRTVREAVKRRAVQAEPLDFATEDLRYRQLVRRATPALNAVVVFVLDVSASMDEAQRKLAKSFFFFALHGIRRRYAKVESVFIAHTVNAWEFSEEQFFQVSGSGGTVASSAFRLALELLKTRYDPGRYNAYLFYASDGENASDDRESAGEALAELAEKLNYAGYVELGSSGPRPHATQMAELFEALEQRGCAVSAARLGGDADVWSALRRFFTDQAEEPAE